MNRKVILCSWLLCLTHLLHAQSDKEYKKLADSLAQGIKEKTVNVSIGNFLFGDTEIRFTDAAFEAVSGLTTTLTAASGLSARSIRSWSFITSRYDGCGVGCGAEGRSARRARCFAAGCLVARSTGMLPTSLSPN